ncbi:MAG: ABC transporter substrate-binding protein [Bacteroidetes bacterium]|nr:ABC transporter substrate-binding protein [Bacteroidota bacterium]MCL5026665.1 ABC transporter substrate-binding protein [Chloroflexota bacterium]
MDVQLTTVVLACHILQNEFLARYALNEATGMWGVVPWLAESWEFSDPTTILLRLKKGIRFHDGSDFNADVAKWNLERMINHPKSQAKTNVASIKAVDMVDPYTLKLTLHAPSAAQMVQLTSAQGFAGIVSKSAVEALGDDEFGRRAVGSGPMQFVEWRPTDHVTVRRFDGYWAKGLDGQPLPYLDRVTCFFRPDPTVSLLELKAGELDLIWPVEPKDAAGLKADPKFVYHELLGSESRAVGLNQAGGPFAENLKLRQAVMYSLDREVMAKTLLYGTGGPLYYFWTKDQPGYDESLPRYDYQPERAKQLVKEAGYPAGIDVLFSFISRPMDQRIAEIVQSMLNPTGIRVKLEALERMAWIEKVSRSKKYEMSVWLYSFSPDPALKDAQMTCDGPNNWGGYCNPKFDECMADGNRTADPAKRHEIYKRCQTIFHEDAYWTLTANFVAPYAHHKELRGVREEWLRFDLGAAWLDR